MTDQTPDPWKDIEAELLRAIGFPHVKVADLSPETFAARFFSARGAERQQHQQEIARLKTMGLPQRVADLMLADAHADADIIKALTAEIEQHQQAIAGHEAVFHNACLRIAETEAIVSQRDETIQQQAAQIETLTQALAGLQKFQYEHRGMGIYACRSCGAHASLDDENGLERRESCSSSCPWEVCRTVLVWSTHPTPGEQA